MRAPAALHDPAARQRLLLGGGGRAPLPRDPPRCPPPRRRASQILDGWGSETVALPALRPQTVAAAAVHFAYEEKKGVLFSSEAGQAPPSLDLGRLAKQAGVEKGTILRAMTELPVPPPEEQQQAGPSRVLE